jgi:glycosyltransferase involved in cell wall biosynthesis
MTSSPEFPPLTISVCIPAIPRDVESGCLHELLSSINRQTLLPTDVIISFTNASLEETKRMHQDLQSYIDPVPLRIIRSSELYVQGKSRNNAILGSTSELISFIDADDIMHPQRLRIIVDAFKGNGELELFLHGYSKNLNEQWVSDSFEEKIADSREFVRKNEICNSERRTRHQPHLDLDVHHAHITMRRSIFRIHSFDETTEGFRIEDSLFVRQLVASACKEKNTIDVQFLTLPLTFYRSTGAQCKQTHQRGVDAV